MRDRKPRVIGPREVDSSEPHVDMNRPGSPGYAERHREHSYDIGNGLTRVDYGAPAGAQAARAVPPENAETEHADPSSDGQPSVVRAPAEPTGPAPDWRKDYGLRKSL